MQQPRSTATRHVEATSSTQRRISARGANDVLAERFYTVDLMSEGEQRGATTAIPTTRFRLLFCSAMPSPNDNNNNNESEVHQEEEMKLEEVVLPIRVHLSTISVARLIHSFRQRVGQRYPELIATHAVEALYIRQPDVASSLDLGALTASHDAASLKDLLHTVVAVSSSSSNNSPRTKSAERAKAASASAAASAAASAMRFMRIDAIMNGEDMLDDFFAPSTSPVVPNTYDVVVEWGSTSQDELKHVCDDVESAHTNKHAVWQPSQTSSAMKMFDVCAPSPAVPVHQRSTYMDLRRDRLSRQRTTTVRARRATGELESDEAEEEAAARAGAREQYQERVHLAQEERAAREDLLASEASERGLVNDLEDDAMRHVLTLVSLQGDFTTNGQLVALLRKRRCYPFDTQPLYTPMSYEEKKQIRREADLTAMLSFWYADKDGTATQLFNPPPVVEPPPKTVREMMYDLYVEEKQQEEKEEAEVARIMPYILRGEDPPPPTPTPPPTPRTPRMEDIPTVAYNDLMNRYLRERRELITVERKAFRYLGKMMITILSKQRNMELANVRMAYLEELHAADALDFTAYAQYDQLQRPEDSAVGQLLRAANTCADAPTVVFTGEKRSIYSDVVRHEDDDDDDDDDVAHVATTSATAAVEVPTTNISSTVEDVQRAERSRSVHEAILAVEKHASIPLALRMKRQEMISAEQRQRAAMVAKQAELWAYLREKLDRFDPKAFYAEKEALRLLLAPLITAEEAVRMVVEDDAQRERDVLHLRLQGVLHERD